MSFAGMEGVIAFDLTTFAAAFIALLFFIKIPHIEQVSDKSETLLQSAKSGLLYLKSNKGILWLILFLSAINLIASMHDAALPALIIPKAGETEYGIVNSCVGIATILGSTAATFFPKPKSRIKVICRIQIIRRIQPLDHLLQHHIPQLTISTNVSKTAIDFTDGLNDCLPREFSGIDGLFYHHIIVN